MNDRSANLLEKGQPFRPFSEFMMSLRFLTRMPLPFALTLDWMPLRHALRMFSVAGAVIGLVQGLLLFGFAEVGVPAFIAATLACGCGLLFTGALHEDGVADVADGFGGGRDRESRLAIMHDSRIGSYGTLALMITLLVRISCYREILVLDFGYAIGLLAAAGAFSRAMVVDLMWSTRSARLEGLSAHAGRPSRNAALFAIISGGVIVVAASALHQPVEALYALAAATCLTAMLRWSAIRLIGGQTGDVCGAVQVISECAMLTVYAAMIH